MHTVRRVLPYLLLAGLIAASVAGQPAPASGQAVVNDGFQPISVTGDTLESLQGAPISELFVYVYRDGAWTQIPFQFDEKIVNEEDKRVYSVEGDGLLDADEELVLMLKDMGAEAPALAWVPGADTDSRIELAVEAADGGRRWAYVFRGAALQRTFTQDYVRFSGAAQRIIAERYEAGFLDNGFGLDELRLNASGIDILDRTKIRLEVVVRVFGIPIGRRSCNEDNLTEADGCNLEPRPVAPVKDGPVRLIMGETGGFAYGSLFQDRTEADLPDLPLLGAVSIESLRFSMDFSPEVVATSTPPVYLDPNLSQAVVIDGQPDSVPTQPLPAWRQISQATGTIIQTMGLSSVGGTQRSYYKDDAAFDPDDTGDGRSYGDFGFSVENPNKKLTIETNLLFLPATADDLGAAYAALLDAPPAVTTTLQPRPGPLDHHIYLPLVRR